VGVAIPLLWLVFELAAFKCFKPVSNVVPPWSNPKTAPNRLQRLAF
jgi:hypothetical protein